MFTGYGGLDLALDQLLDTRLAWVADNEPGPILTLARRYPGVPNLGDVRTLTWPDVDPVDVLTGGTPCQDLSHAGKRGGLTGETRSNLWATMREAIAVLHPQLVIWENVRGAISAPADSELELCPGCMGARRPVPPLRALGRVLGDLADLGMDAAWTGIRASDVGAPHERLRIFLLAWDRDRPAATLRRRRGTRPTHGDLRGPLLPTPTTQDGANTAGPSQFRRHSLPLNAVATLLPTPVVNDMGDNKTIDWWDEWAPRQVSSTGAAAPHGPSLAIEARRGATSWGKYADAVQLWEQLTRPAPDPTAPAPDPRDDPQLSPRFVEWMQGLPPGWVTDIPGITRNQQLRMLGNGVVPQQAAAALDPLLDEWEDDQR